MSTSTNGRSSPSRQSAILPTNNSSFLSLPGLNSSLPKEYVQRLEVAYGDDDDDRPHDCIAEVNGRDPKIDFNGGSKWVSTSS